MFERKKKIIKALEKKKNNLSSSINRERFWQVLNNDAAILIWIINPQGKWLFCNKICLKFLGATVAEQLIDNCFFYLAPDDRAVCRQVYQSACDRHNSFEIEFRLLRSDGYYRWILTTAVPKFDRKGDLSGFICAGIDITQRKTKEDLLLQQLLSDRHTAWREHLLKEIVQKIHACLDLEMILQSAIDGINQLLWVKRIIIAKIVDPQESEILFEAVNLGVGSSCKLANSKQKLIIDLKTSWQQLQNGEIVIQENWFFPLVIEQKLWGLVSLQQFSTVSDWQSSEIETIQQINQQLAIALVRAEKYQNLIKANQELEQLVVIDSLTGIANRRKFDRYLANEWLRLARENAPLALIFCDIDYFKLYNDTYGHQAGDRCLYQVAQALNKTIKRPADLAARYGGEELAVILPNTTFQGALIVAKQISLQVKALAIPHINSPIDLYVTLSIGVAGCIPSSDSSVEILIKNADRALYEAKQLGRNQIVRATKI